MSDDLPIMEMTLTDLRAAMAGGRLSCVDIAEAAIERIERLNPGLNAIVRFDPEEVRRQARTLDERREAGDDSPWLGIPVTVKDNIWIAGRQVATGSRLFEDFEAPEDAIAVARLRNAGALILGSTNCSEFACKGVTANLLHGETRNPWDLTRTPGGSSGGAASATAAGLGCLALGTDAGGSVRRPASHVGVVGMKPSSGMIPHAGGFDEPIYGNSVIGTMTRSVADAWEALALLAHHDPADPQSPSCRAPLRPITEPLPPSRIAWSPRLGLGFAVDPDVMQACEQAIEALRDAGHDVVAVDPPWPDGASEEALMPLQFASLAAIYGARYRARDWQVDPDIGRQIEAGLALSGAEVAAALEMRKALYNALTRLFRDRDFLLSPTTPATAWPLGQMGPARIEGHDASPRAHAVFTPIFNHCHVPACSVPCGLDGGGLPVGLQIAGPLFSDDRVLALAAHVEGACTVDFTRVRQVEGLP
ncbi:amidase [Oceanibium sediminis]|uniref:amidase n=1 Tax=Oceanibium sediminis TaxID=2026339 RepID=UPI0018E59FB1|nr:amidase [Oceanibium sediminis]